MSHRQGGGRNKVLLPPINFIFKLLQQHSTVQIWLYEQLGMRIEGKIRGFDEFMNLVIDDAVEVKQSTKHDPNPQDGPNGGRRELGMYNSENVLLQAEKSQSDNICVNRPDSAEGRQRCAHPGAGVGEELRSWEKMILQTADPLLVCYQNNVLQLTRDLEKRSEQGTIHAHQAQAHDKRIQKD